MFGRSVRRRAWGGLFIVSSNRYEFRAFTPDGSPARIVRMDHVLRVPTDENIEAEIHQRVSRIVDPAERRAERRELRAMPVAEHLPAFAAVRTDRLDHLWVHEYEAPGEETPAHALHRLRSRRPGVGVVRDARGYGDSGDRRGLHPGPGQGRARGGLRAGVAAGAGWWLRGVGIDRHVARLDVGLNGKLRPSLSMLYTHGLRNIGDNVGFGATRATRGE